MRFVSGAYEFGKGMRETKDIFVFSSENELISQHAEILDRNLYVMIPEFVAVQLSDTRNPFHKLLASKEKNQFQKDVINALHIYSQHCLKRSCFDRLLYIFSAIESILIANDTERIQTSIADRMAFFLTKDKHERRTI